MLPKEIVLALTAEDYVGLNRYYIKKHPSGRRRAMKIRIFLPLAMALFFFAVCKYNWMLTRDATLLFAEIGVFLVWILFYEIFRTPLTLAFAKMRIKRRMKNEPAFCTPATCCFDEDGFTIFTEKEKDACSYDLIVLVGRSKEGLYLFRAKNIALILPARCFSSEDEMNAFADLVEEKSKAPGKDEPKK